MDGNTHLDHDLRALKLAAAHLRSAANRTCWRTAMQRRGNRLSSTLANLGNAVTAPTFKRMKVNGDWHFFWGKRTVMVIATRPPGHALADLSSPFIVEVHHPEFVVLEDLQRLVDMGHIRLLGPTRAT